jgi:Ca2+-binding EF-hand superfamily protein
MAANNFSLDHQEYKSVFRVFDKDNTGEITINQVLEVHNRFQDSQKTTEQDPGQNKGLGPGAG